MLGIRTVVLFLASSIAIFCWAQTQLSDIWNKANQTAQSGDVGSVGLNSNKIAAGLKEALTLSTGKAVAATGKRTAMVGSAEAAEAH